MLSDETKVRYRKEVAKWEQYFRDKGRKEIPRIRKMSKQDPELPRRPLNPYIHFFKAVLPLYRKKYPTMKYKPDLLRLIAKHWKRMTREQKTPYYDSAREGLAAYKSILSQVKQAKKCQAAIRRSENKEMKLKKLSHGNYPNRKGQWIKPKENVVTVIQP